MSTEVCGRRAGGGGLKPTLISCFNLKEKCPVSCQGKTSAAQVAMSCRQRAGMAHALGTDLTEGKMLGGTRGQTRKSHNNFIQGAGIATHSHTPSQTRWANMVPLFFRGKLMFRETVMLFRSQKNCTSWGKAFGLAKGTSYHCHS